MGSGVDLMHRCDLIVWRRIELKNRREKGTQKMLIFECVFNAVLRVSRGMRCVGKQGGSRVEAGWKQGGSTLILGGSTLLDHLQA